MKDFIVNLCKACKKSVDDYGSCRGFNWMDYCLSGALVLGAVICFAFGEMVGAFALAMMGALVVL